MAQGRAVPALPLHMERSWLDVMVLVLVAAALVLVDLVAPAFPGSGGFLVLLIPVVLCAAILGPRRGIVALVLGALGAVILVPVRGHPWLSSPDDVARLMLYLAVGTGTIIAIGAIPRERHGTWRVIPPPAAGPPQTGLVEPLTLRELDVLRLAARGASNDEIGRHLYVSRNTVKSHLAHAYGKLGAHNRAQAIAAGLNEGLLDADSLCDPDGLA
jgi:DNA-binding CsgD family transcriptional regulator